MAALYLGRSQRVLHTRRFQQPRNCGSHHLGNRDQTKLRSHKENLSGKWAA
jgi:hypothetical protein